MRWAGCEAAAAELAPAPHGGVGVIVGLWLGCGTPQVGPAGHVAVWPMIGVAGVPTIADAVGDANPTGAGWDIARNTWSNPEKRLATTPTLPNTTMLKLSRSMGVIFAIRLRD